MSFLAKLIIDEETINVMECSFDFNQSADHTGKPSQHPKGGQIELLIETTKKIDLLDWVISPNTLKNGEIIFYKRDNLSSLKKIKFNDAYCLSLEETFDANDKNPFKTHLLISSKELNVNDIEFKTFWFSKN